MRPQRRQPTRFPHPWDSLGKNTGVGCHFLLQCMKVKSASEVSQSCLTLSNPMDCSPPGSSVHGIFQARVLEWGAIAFSESMNIMYVMTSLVAQLVKNPSAMWKTWAQSLGWEEPLEEGMATHSSILAWRILMDRGLVWRIPMDRGAWQATVHRVAKSQTQLSDWAHNGSHKRLFLLQSDGVRLQQSLKKLLLLLEP